MTSVSSISEDTRIPAPNFYRSTAAFPEAPFWTADTPAGNFVYGIDLTGAYYWSGRSDRYESGDVATLEEARTEAIRNYEEAVSRNPAISLVEGTQ